jgi:Mrp family chromosome partitioning ATPase
MRLHNWKDSPKMGATADFDLLRARLEVEIARPSVIAVTSSTNEDGKEIAAQGLAYSFAGTGYRALFVDSSLSGGGLSKPAPGLTLEEIGRLVTHDPGTGNSAVLTLNDIVLQRTTSRRNVESALDILRSKFDYVVISTEEGVSTPFATAIVSAADAVLVTVKTGRREKAGDTRLAAALRGIGSRFLGVLALDRTIIREGATIVTVAAANPRRTLPAHMDKTRQRLEVAEPMDLWPTSSKVMDA